ncbi:hypothetical protein [Pseudomonas sp. Ps21-P2]|jgi:hypothetical protein|uniref:hypothetical protein n=1 Tax=Pseudomonas sp. Ps21-P2 TaxID=3080331 RepID=UPI00320A1CDB
MKALKSSFSEIFFFFLKDATIKSPEALGLKSFSPDELIANDYELAGEVNDYHFFEKFYNVTHKKRFVGVVFKRYFFQDQPVGSGFKVLKGVRLTSLLKEYINYGQHHPEVVKPLTFYFFHDKKDGAVIFDDSLVVRFSHNNQREGYQVKTLESDFDETGTLNKAATNAIKYTMDFHQLEWTRTSLKKQNYSSAYRRLVKALEVKAKHA